MIECSFKKFKKKKEFKAIQLTASNGSQIVSALSGLNIKGVWDAEDDTFLILSQLLTNCEPGDWLVKDLYGKMRRYKNELFNDLFEESMTKEDQAIKLLKDINDEVISINDCVRTEIVPILDAIKEGM